MNNNWHIRNKPLNILQMMNMKKQKNWRIFYMFCKKFKRIIN